MRRDIKMLAATALVLLPAPLTAPLAAQGFSEGFTFLKGVRDRDGNAVTAILSDPGSTAVNTRDPSNGEGALHILVRGRDLTWLNFLLGRGARPDLAMNDGTTPLILAAQLGWREGAERLIARGADPNLGNRNGETPLIFAVHRRNLPLVRLLLANGADPDQTDNVSGYSAIDYARRDRRSAAILRELEQALEERRAETTG